MKGSVNDTEWCLDMERGLSRGMEMVRNRINWKYRRGVKNVSRGEKGLILD